MSQPTIGIIGGSGFIGNQLANSLQELGKVMIIDIKPPHSNKIGFQKCDIRNYQEVKAAVLKSDIILHTAIIQIPQIITQRRLGYDVNLLGTHNICQAVSESSRTKGLIMTGTWHTIGERELTGIVNEEYGFHPDKVESRARLYALSKIAQEVIVRFHDEMSEKVFSILRIGTVLGEEMPEKTAANLFINNGLQEKPITPYKHSMYRPMLYVDIQDICAVFEILIKKILTLDQKKTDNSLSHIYNIYNPHPLNILDLANHIRDIIQELSHNSINPLVKIKDMGEPMLFSEEDKKKITVDISKPLNDFKIKKFIDPVDTLTRIIRCRLDKMK